MSDSKQENQSSSDGRNIICSKCQLTGSSKCPGCRSVFTFTALPYYCYQVVDLKTQIVIKIPTSGTNSIKEAIDGFLEFAQDHNNGKFKDRLTWDQMACDHDWKFKPGQKSKIGCQCFPEESEK